MTARIPAARHKDTPAKTGAAPEKKIKKTREDKPAKTKVVRDSFTMPWDDYAKLAELKRRLQEVGVHAKKSELLRAGLHALARLDPEHLTLAVARLEPIKAGRPKKA